MRIRLLLLLAPLLAAPWGVRADTPPGGHWRPIPELSDEFNGERLDAAKWDVRSLYYPGKKPGLYVPYNTTQKHGFLNLWAQAETLPKAPPGYHSYTTAYVSATQPIRYGYIEVRARPMNSRINCGFWLYRWTETGTYEIDIFEIAGAAPENENAVHINAHYYKGQPELENERNRVSAPFTWYAGATRLADDFHVYGLEWDENELRFYFDGRLVHTKANTVWHLPMYIRFSTETHPDWFGLPRAGELPAVFQVDYLRVWQRRDPSRPDGAGGDQ